MGKWCIRTAWAMSWLSASAAAYAQAPPAPPLPLPPPVAAPAAPPAALAPTAPALPGGYLPPQFNFAMHPPITATPNGLSAPNGLTPQPPAAPEEPPAVADGPSAFTGQGDSCPPNAFGDACPPCTLPCHVELEYLAWWTKHQDLPVLVTSGSFSDPVPGALGQPGTQDLVSGQIDRTFHDGARLSYIWDIDCDHTYLLDVGGFFLGYRNTQTTVSSDGGPNTPVIARPFFNGNTNTQDADPVAVPNVMSGSITIQQPQSIYGADFTLHTSFWYHDNLASAGYWLVGGQFLALDERLLIGESLQDIPGLGVPGNSYLLNEHFSTFNRFYGGTVGLEYVYGLGCLVLKAQAKVGLGDNVETLGIGGLTQITDNSTGNVTTGLNRALLVQPSNAGTYHLNRFAAAPEVHLTSALDITQNIRVSAGYDFLYLTSALRPSGAVDPTVNIQALQPFDQVGPARPAPLTNQSSFWAQGVNFTLEFSF